VESIISISIYLSIVSYHVLINHSGSRIFLGVYSPCHHHHFHPMYQITFYSLFSLSHSIAYIIITHLSTLHYYRITRLFCGNLSKKITEEELKARLSGSDIGAVVHR
jgi:hypothetical protein